MNPLAWLNPGRWLLYLALAGALVAGYFAWADHIGDVREAAVRAEYAAKTLVAEQAARAREQALQFQVTKAQNDAQARQTILVADAARTAVVANSLRNQLAIARRDLSSASIASTRKYATTLNDVFGECTAGYSALARQADGHASDSLMYQQGWPK